MTPAKIAVLLMVIHRRIASAGNLKLSTATAVRSEESIDKLLIVGLGY